VIGHPVRDVFSFSEGAFVKKLMMLAVFGFMMSLVLISADAAPKGAKTEPGAATTWNWKPGVLEETGSIDEGNDEESWVNSGAAFIVERLRDKGQDMLVGRTLLRQVKDNGLRLKWRKEYKTSNPKDTLGGTLPETVFRLFYKKKLKDYSFEVYFYIEEYYAIDAPERKGVNGVVICLRATEKSDGYYTYVCADGGLRIKMRQNDGADYTTFVEEHGVFPGTYSQKPGAGTSQCLLPQKQWVGLKGEVLTLDDGTVRLRLFLDRKADGSWEQIAETIDKGASFPAEGYTLLRSDFMGVRFRNPVFRPAKK
jgi:hypothetical protein